MVQISIKARGFLFNVNSPRIKLTVSGSNNLTGAAQWLSEQTPPYPCKAVWLLTFKNAGPVDDDNIDTLSSLARNVDWMAFMWP